MKASLFDMERGIARCRVALSLVAILALYVDPTEPSLTRWLPLTGGAFTVNRYWATVLVSHLIYSLTVWLRQERIPPSRRLAAWATWADVLFAAAIALVTEGSTSPFFSFFSFAVLAAGLRSGRRAALWVTGVSVALYLILILTSAPGEQAYFIVMRAAYIAITGYLVGYLGQERINQEGRIRDLEAMSQREQIARSLHDGYAQALAGIDLRLGSCVELYRRGDHAAAIAELRELHAGVNREQDELRTYIRSLIDRSDGGRPAPVDDGTHAVIQAEFSGSPQRVEHVLLILLEGVRNVGRHARARAASLRAHHAAGQVVITIDDDGVGFGEGGTPPWAIASRVAECNGELHSHADEGGGAHLLIRLPEER